MFVLQFQSHIDHFIKLSTFTCTIKHVTDPSDEVRILAREALLARTHRSTPCFLPLLQKTKATEGSQETSTTSRYGSTVSYSLSLDVQADIK